MYTHRCRPSQQRRGSRFGTQKIVRFGTRERYRFGTRVRASRLEAIATTSLHCLVANCNPPHPPPPTPHPHPTPTPPPHPTRSLVCAAEVCLERPSKRVCVREDVDLVQSGNPFSTSESHCLVANCDPPHPIPPTPPHPSSLNPPHLSLCVCSKVNQKIRCVVFQSDLAFC